MSWIPQSLATRLTIFQGFSLVIVMLILPVALTSILSRTSDRIEFDFLAQQAQVLSGEIEVRADGSLMPHLSSQSRAHFSVAYGRYTFDVLNKDGEILLTSTQPLMQHAPTTWTPPNEPKPFSTDADGRSLSGATVPVTIGGLPYWIRVAEDLSHRDALQDDVVREFLPNIFTITSFVFLVFLGTQIYIVKRSFRSISKAAETLADITAETSFSPLHVSRLPAEISPFVDAVNATLRRLHAGYLAQRQFASDASHELRTPLCVLRMRIEMLGSSEIKETLLRDVEQMTRTINEFIELAEVGSMREEPLGQADLNAVCIEVTEALAILAIDSGTSLALDVPKTRVLVRGNQDLIYCAVRNLVENAIRASRPNEAVEISVGERFVCVSDWGPGIPHENRSTVFDRFTRIGHGSGPPGGLGLSIVRQIADIHGATLSILDRSEGGTSLQLVFP